MLRLANGYSFQNTTLHQSWGNIYISGKLVITTQRHDTETNFRYVVIYNKRPKLTWCRCEFRHDAGELRMYQLEGL